MKIKEVIEKTGLTDRAIRLYIDEGLVLPNIAESYSGRKSIEFSENDVERLKNVALLRKAGFSIADIKSMVDDNSTAENIVKNFIEQTENNIAHETEIVEKLKEISFDEGVTIETICESLCETVEEKEVPGGDMRMTLKEKIQKVVAVSFALINLAYAVSALVWICLIIFNFRYIKFDSTKTLALTFYAGWAIGIFLPAIVIHMNTGKRFQRRKKWLTPGILVVSVLGNLFFSFVSFFLLFASVTPFYSQTSNPDNYLKLDSHLEEYREKGYPDYFMHSLSEVFPKAVPSSARLEPWRSDYPDTTKYFYEFKTCSDGYYGSYDICAEWVLSADEYEKAKNDLRGDFILDKDLFFISQLENISDETEKYLLDARIAKNKYKIISKGDWTMVYYVNKVGFMNSEGVSEKSKAEQHYLETGNEFEIKKWDTEEYRTSYHFLICAYNDKLQKVRYIASECCYHCTPADGPYYLSLDW
ncbi:MAG: MerR family transcriptional regulator [Clostridia bacterium]|nr:MerR family transcriptional regulator [Clostridia bacterium]